MTPAIGPDVRPASGVAAIVIKSVIKHHGGLRPLRLADLAVAAGEIVSVRGFDEAQAEVVVGLVTGSILPDEGEVVVLGEPTTAAGTAEQWLASLDRIGLVTARASLLDDLSIAQNIAIPLTLDLDGMAASMRDEVRGLAAVAGIDGAILDRRAGEAAPRIRMQAHLARALALKPRILLVEHASASLAANEARVLGRTVARAAAGTGLSVLALTADDRFADALGGRRMSWLAASGEVRRVRSWARWF